MNCHELDEIINEKLINPDFVLEGKAGLAFYLGQRNGASLKQMLVTWNKQKNRFATIPANSPGNNRAISAVTGNRRAKSCWQLFLQFIDNGGCPLPVDPAILFCKLNTKIAFEMPANLSCQSDFRCVKVCACEVRQG